MSRADGESVRMPTVFLPHGGGPCFFMDWTIGPADTWDRMRDFLLGASLLLPRRPAALLVVSAHYEEPIITLTGGSQPGLVYDYYGFPPHTYELGYPAAGSPDLTRRASQLLAAAGIPSQIDEQRGLDHGVFVPLKLMFPNADVPIVQLSLRSDLDPAFHLAVGRALVPLRREDVLIVGSGMSYHHTRDFMTARAASASQQFDSWLVGTCRADPALREAGLARWEQAPAARAAHPREEHLLPLMVCAGAAEDDAGHHVFSDIVMQATVSALAFGDLA